MKQKNASLALAPMAGVGDRAFREVCRLAGADRVTTEMISAKAFSFQDKKTLELARVSPREAPVSLQLFGHEPDALARAAAFFSATGDYAAIDLNFGCPVPKVAGSGDGSALLKDLPLLYEIAARVVEASRVPVTAKLRLGWDGVSVNAPEAARLLEQAGVSLLALHGRTRADLYRPGTVRRDLMAQTVRAVSIPVLANGDVTDGPSALAMLAETGAAGLMIGRGALGAPWVFTRIRAALEGRPAPEIDEKALIRLHVKKAFAYKPTLAGAELRTHFAHYLKGFPGAARLREAVTRCSLEREYLAVIDEIPEKEA